MRHLGLAALLLLAAGSQARAGAKCVKLSAAIQKKLTAATEFSLKAFEKALARQQLKLVALPLMTVDVDGVLVPGNVVTRNDTGKAKQYVVGPMIYVPSGQAGNPAWEFVTDAAGDVWQLVRKPTVKSRVHYTICGCGPVGSGVEPQQLQVLYQLPDGVTYRGEVTVSYQAREVTIGYTNTLPKGGPCPQPP